MDEQQERYDRQMFLEMGAQKERQRILEKVDSFIEVWLSNEDAEAHGAVKALEALKQAIQDDHA